MIGQAFSTSHGTGHPYTHDVTLPHNDKINHVPLFQPWVHLGGLVLEQGVGDAQGVFHTVS